MENSIFIDKKKETTKDCESLGDILIKSKEINMQDAI